MPVPPERSATRRSRRARERHFPVIVMATIALLLAIFTVGNVGQSTASLRDTTSGDVATVQAASIKAISDLTPAPTVQFSAGVTEKTGGFTVTNTGTIDATYRTVTSATGSAPLMSGIRVSVWPAAKADGCLTAPLTAVTGTWASFPALTGSLGAGGSQFYCVKSTLITPVGLASPTTVTATFATTLSRSNWTSDATSTVTQTFKDDAPSAPSGLFFSGTTSASTTLNWAASTDDVAVTGYDVYRGTTLLGSTTGATSFIVTGLAASTNYTFTVKARDGAEHTSASSPTASVATLTVNAPSGWFQLVNTKSQMCVDASGSGTVNFTPLVLWTCSVPAATNQQWSFSGPNTAGYYTVVPRHTTSIIWDVEAASNTNAARIILYQPNSGTNQQWSIIAVGADTYQFVARNSGKCMATVGGATTAGTSFEQVTCNSSDPAQTFSLRAPDTTAPTTPTNLAATTASATSLSLKWTAATDAVGVTEYLVYRNGTLLASRATGTTFVDTGLTPGTSYTYRVQARDAAGNTSGYSNYATAQTSRALQTLACTGEQWYLYYSWTNNERGSSSVASYGLYVNGSNTAATVADTWQSTIGLSSDQAYLYASAGSTVPVVLKQKLTNGQESTIATGSVRLQWVNGMRVINCG